MREITEQTEVVDGEPIFWRSAAWEGTPTLYLHGVPTGSFDWIPFLERSGGMDVKFLKDLSFNAGVALAKIGERTGADEKVASCKGHVGSF